jgi:sirohydrochlorin cobaltochelatase
MVKQTTITKKPMAAAPFVYDEKGQIAWDKMWESYCYLAKDGGPAHRGKSQRIKKKDRDMSSVVKNSNFSKISAEALRGVSLILPYPITISDDGWLIISLHSQNVAKWFSEVINEENVVCEQHVKDIYLPLNDTFDIEHDVKSIITVAGKAHHYWTKHRTFFSKMMVILFGIDPQWISPH